MTMKLRIYLIIIVIPILILSLSIDTVVSMSELERDEEEKVYERHPIGSLREAFPCTDSRYRMLFGEPLDFS